MVVKFDLLSVDIQIINYLKSNYCYEYHTDYFFFNQIFSVLGKICKLVINISSSTMIFLEKLKNKILSNS